MDAQSEHERRIAQLEERLALLSEATLRISESLDFDTVLQQVLDSARDLVDARYGVMATRDEHGGLEAVLTSGTTDDAHRQVASLHGGAEIFSHLIAVPDPIRVDRWDEYAASVGLNGFLPMPVCAGLSAPIRHRGGPLGVICVGHDQEERKFGAGDEETLVMFAAQAAMVITNARRHRQEQQTRADLETLIETSPVGVVVLDARTGAPKSFNRETSRIVDRLRDPGQSAAELLEAVNCKRADGREISLREFQMAELLSIGETVRAEEIELRVDDGRQVTVLLNATPIVSNEGAVESVVVTMQDMAEVEELEHLRADFLAMVSHELRAPLSTIKGSASTLMDSAMELDPAVVRQFARIIGEQVEHLNSLVSDLLDVARIQTGELPVSPEPAEAVVLVDRARTAFVNAGGSNPLQIDIESNLPLVMADRRRVVQVLVNLLNNACRNAPEGSVVVISVARDDVHLAVSVSDRGRGIPPDSLPHLFRKFSGVRSEDQGADTGLGLAICKGIVEAHGGRIWAESDGPGLGARFTFTLPTVEAAGGMIQEPSPPGAERADPNEGHDVIRVLAVDDDPQALRYIREVLIADGYEVVVTGDPQEALRLMTDELPHLVLLDLVLPDVDGIELMGEVHTKEDVPVIFLSAYGRDELIARAFEQGASDYVVKPFSPTELSARIKAALRRREVSLPLPPYVLGDLSVDYATRLVTLAGEPVQLTPTEYRMLAELSANGGQLITYERLMSRAWRNRSGDDLRPMRTMMGKLRRKLGEDTEQPRYIFTEQGVGYRMPKSEAQRNAIGPARATES